jgi:hypothetical protein
MPLRWAATQNNLGNALKTMGERESGTAGLEDTIAAHRAALEEYTRDRAPLQWAMSTGNQGIAFMLIADQLDDATKAQSAIAVRQPRNLRAVQLCWEIRSRGRCAISALRSMTLSP